MKCKVVALFTITGREVTTPLPIGDAVDMHGDCAYAMIGEQISSTMIGARVSQIAANGLVISGVERLGDGRLVVQKWWCAVGAEKP